MNNERRDEIYLGHRIHVEAEERRPGCWGWRYLIDGTISAVSRTAVCPDVEVALRQGLKAAESRIEEMLHQQGAHAGSPPSAEKRRAAKPLARPPGGKAGERAR